MNDPKISTLVINFHDSKNEKNDYIFKLQNEGILDIKLWIGESEKANIKRYRHPIVDKNFVKMDLLHLDDDFENKFFDQYFSKYLDCASRWYIDVKKHNELFENIFKYSYYDSRDEFRFFLRYFYALIKKNKIELILFFSIPHHGWDLILFYLARELKIKKLMYNFFPYLNGMCSHILIQDIDDIGLYKTAFEISEIKIRTFCLENLSKQKNYYYEALSNQEPANLFNQKVNFYLDSSFSGIIKVLIWKLSGYLNSFKRVELELKMSHIEKSKKLKKDLLLGRFAYFHSDESMEANREYYGNYKKNAKDVDLNEKYVLFLLHYQPELSTSPVADIYNDQMLAIERLSALMPDYKIYVKENFCQDYHMRGDLFFKRLGALKNVSLVKMEYDTFKLMDSSMFVTSVSGTGCFEAICRGKNALIFNNKVWYCNLPGIYLYKGRETEIDKILGSAPTPKEIEDKILNSFHSKINNCYLEIINPSLFDKKIITKEENNNNLYLEIKTYISKIFNL